MSVSLACTLHNVEDVDNLLVDDLDDLSQPLMDNLPVEVVDKESNVLMVEAVDAELKLGRLQPS